MAIFRVRNLLIQVLPREAQGVPVMCDIDSGDGGCDDSGDCGDSLDCGDTGNCGDEDTGGCDASCGDTGGCGTDSGGCDTDSCGDPDTGGCGTDSGGCDTDSCVNPDTGGCGSDSCGDPDTGGCGNPDTPACTAFECSLHFDTVCEPGRDPSGCDQITQVCEIPGITVHCQAPATLECIAVGTQCQVLNSLPICLDPTNTKCGDVISLQPQLGIPVGLCFRSNEPKINPNSLADLGVLRRQLAAGLRTVQRRERALAKALTPRTTRQIATAEAYLASALRDLKQRRQFIQSRAAAKKAVESKKNVAPVEAAKKSPARKSPTKKGRRRK